jgi:hypothetical protein
LQIMQISLLDGFDPACCGREPVRRGGRRDELDFVALHNPFAAMKQQIGARALRVVGWWCLVKLCDHVVVLSVLAVGEMPAAGSCDWLF